MGLLSFSTASRRICRKHKEEERATQTVVRRRCRSGGSVGAKTARVQRRQAAGSENAPGTSAPHPARCCRGALHICLHTHTDEQRRNNKRAGVSSSASGATAVPLVRVQRRAEWAAVGGECRTVGRLGGADELPLVPHHHALQGLHPAADHAADEQSLGNSTKARTATQRKQGRKEGRKVSATRQVEWHSRPCNRAAAALRSCFPNAPRAVCPMCPQTRDRECPCRCVRERKQHHHTNRQHRRRCCLC